MEIIKKMAVNEGTGMTFALSVNDVVDRHGDIVEVSEKSVMLDNFRANPVALAFHDHSAPVGLWKNIRITGGKLLADLQLAKKGTSEFIDTLHSLVEQGIVKAVSIGFKPVEAEYIDEKDPWGGMRFKRWELLEASLVSVPAHPQALAVAKSLGASTDTINRIFSKSGEASTTGQKAEPKPTKSAGDTAKKPQISKDLKMKTIQEQIAAFQEKRTAAANLMSGLMTKAGDEGRTLEDTESEQYDAASIEIGQIDKHLERLKAAEAVTISKATPVDGTGTKAAADNRAGVVVVKDNLAPGQEFARYAKCLAQAKGNLMQAEQIAKSQYPDSARIQTVLKAAVASGTTTDATWASPLVQYQDFAGDFINFLRPQTIIGRFGQGGIPGLRSIPFNVRIKGQTSGGEGYWVGEGAPKPLTKFDFVDVELRWAKVANIAVLTDELVRMSTPSAELLVRDSLAQALIARLDVDFVNPAKAEVSGVSPASITNGVTAVTASGTDYDAFKVDAKTMMGNFIAANIPLSDGVWVMQSTQALAFSLMQNALGQAEFPGMSMNGGTLLGLPVIVSQYVPSGVIVLAAASEIYLADDGQVMIDTSREATLMMDSDPTATATRSMFQNNEIAIRAERYINWSKRRAAAVQLITGAAYA
jgi:HK97 family phage major capsid protein/HK97 family phage prohead protease